MFFIIKNMIQDEIIKILKKNNIKITGVLHVGAHECEELPFYINNLNIKHEDIIWIEAIIQKVNQQKSKGIPNVFHALVTDKDNDNIDFNISNNIQSSSIFNFGTHSTEHPWCVFVSKIKQTTTTIDTFLKNNNFDPKKYNFWNFDIQGAELLALKGASDAIKHVDVVYLEVNEKELYIGCALIGDIDKFMTTCGFKRVLTEMTCHGWGDALYIRTSLFKNNSIILNSNGVIIN